MNYIPITAVGIDVSKSKSTVAIRRPGGEIVKLPFDVQHNVVELQQLISTLQSIGGDIRIVMEHTGMYWRPIALSRPSKNVNHLFVLSAHSAISSDDRFISG